MSLISLDEARAQLRIPDADGSADSLLSDYVAGITAVVERHVGEVIDVRTVTERLQCRGGRRFALRHAPVVALTSVTDLYGSAYDVSGMDVDPDTGGVEVFRGSAPVGTVVVVYEAGYVTPPNNYKQGALVILQHVWETQRGVGSIASGVIGMEEMHARVGTAFTVPRKAEEWLGPAAPGVG